MNKLIIAFVLCNLSLQAQVADNSLPDKTKTYYWFYVKLGKTLRRETRTNRIFIKNIGSEIKSGSLDEFIKEHQSGLKSGRISLGPFAEESHVLQARLLYKYARSNSRVPVENSASEDIESNYSFFYIKPISDNFLHDITLERIPSRVTNGTQDDFMAILNEGLNFDKLAVGPFHNYELAEKSKFVYGRNGESGSENKVDSIKNKNLKIMSKKWKSLNLKIVKRSDDKELKKSIYRFSTKFPRKYFAPNAVQAITIKASYSDSFHTSANSFTLQGDKVIDNNYVVSSVMGTVYINVLYFDMYSPAKIKGFLFESFIYNDSEMIELEPIYITVK